MTQTGPTGSRLSVPGSGGKSPHGAGASARRRRGRRRGGRWGVLRLGGSSPVRSLIGRFEGQAAVGGARGGRVRSSGAGRRAGCCRWLWRTGRIGRAAALRSATPFSSRPCSLSESPLPRDTRRTAQAVTGLGEGQRPVPLQELAPGFGLRGKLLRAWGKIIVESVLTRCR